MVDDEYIESVDIKDLEIGMRLRFIARNPISYRISAKSAELLALGEIYTVSGFEIHDWHTEVFLHGFGNTVFNSVWFQEVQEPAD